MKVLFNSLKFRSRRIVYSTLSIILLRGITIIVSFLSFPLLLKYLGDERFGLFTTVVSFFSVITFADFGLGMGLQNRIPEFQNDNSKLKKAISTCFIFLLIITSIVCVIFLCLYKHINWSSVYNVKDYVAVDDSIKLTIVFFLIMLFNLPFSIVQRIQYGLQEAYFNSYYQILASLIGLVLLYISVSYNYGLSLLVIAIYGTNSFFLLINFIHFFLRGRQSIIPSFKYFDYSVLKWIFKDGLNFSIIQVLFLVSTIADNFIIAHILGIGKVTIFAVGIKLVSLATIPAQAVMAPALPAINDAILKKDKNWIIKMFNRGLILFIIGSVICSLVFCFTGNLAIRFWLGPEKELDIFLIASFSVYVIYSNLNFFYSYFMMSRSLIKDLVKIYPYSIILSLVIKTISCYYYGISGLLISTVVVMIIFFFVPSHRLIKKSI